MGLIDLFMKILLAGLLIFTPIACGSIELWAYSLMELGILSLLILWAFQSIFSLNPNSTNPEPGQESTGPASRIANIKLVGWLLSFFFLLILLQIVTLPPILLKALSPKTYALRTELLASDFFLSFFPFGTQLEFFKWLTLVLLFLFLLSWRSLQRRLISKLILVSFGVGVFESLYGMFEYFSGHRHILHLRMDHVISSVTGTFINRNAFAGYLLMVIPLSMGYLFSREVFRFGASLGWRHRLSTLDGKTLLIAFGIILMILGLLFSASRMGIISLLISFSLVSLLFRNVEGGRRLSRPSLFIFGLALLWAGWIGLDAVISRFFTTAESFGDRWRLWEDTFRIIQDYPFFGIGLGAFTQVFPMYRSFHLRGLVTHAENDFLQLIAEVGLIGAGILFISFVFLAGQAMKRFRTLSHRRPERYIGMGGWIGILALMFHSLVERNLQIPANAFLYTFIFAILLRLSVSGKK